MVLNDDDKQLSEVPSSLSGHKPYFLEVNIMLLEIYSIYGSSFAVHHDIFLTLLVDLAFS